jgi:hypothetical protein
VNDPNTTLDARYSDPKATPAPWASTRSTLEAAELAWVVTLRPDGSPHATPVVTVWVDDAMHFTTGAEEQKAVNLRTDDRVMLQTGALTWEEGSDIVVEGSATLVTDPALLGQLAAAFRERWDGRWQYEVRGDRLCHPEGFEVLTYRVRPRRVLAFAQGLFGHTLHSFTSE